MPKFDLFYHKIPKINMNQFSDLSANDSYDPFSLTNIQFFNPLYNELFNLDKNTYNKISLNHKFQFLDTNHLFDTTTKNTLEQPVFIKFSPLLDPTRYMVGKYKDFHSNFNNLPTFDDNSGNIISKILDPNNVSYIDNFFYFLTSKTLHTHNFINSIDYYGSFLAIQKQFKVEISEDIEYLYSSSFFNNNVNSLFSVSIVNDEFHNFSSRANKNRLCFSKSLKHNITVNSLPDIDNPITDSSIDSCSVIYEKTNSINSDNEDNNSTCSINSSSSSNDSNISNSTDDNEHNDDDEEHDDDDDDDDDDSTYWETDSSNDSVCEESFAYINNFPIQAICIEKCKGTFDKLFENEKLSSHESVCALFQVIMTLLCYQKSFHFTHNDLHTNNIMYIETDIDFLHYKYNKQIYKVPTYGRIYKIIDFGRSIYRFNNRLYCSDSFGPSGDASTQYNCEPYLNTDKPRIDPNFSFDLCRLGCSLYDFIIDDDEDTNNFNDLQKIVQLWCSDDNGKNILYKKNGEERYPDFKLYKMIARTVHHHTPEAQLKLPYFKQFEISKDDISNQNIINIDDIPIYT